MGIKERKDTAGIAHYCSSLAVERISTLAGLSGLSFGETYSFLKGSELEKREDVEKGF